MVIDEFYSLLENKGYEVTLEKKEKITLYLDLIIQYNKVMDLTANETIEEIIEKNFYDSIISLPQDDYDGKSLIDIGSGAGFPGVLYAIMFPRLKVTLLEPIHKRASFLTKVKESLELSNVEIVCLRAEDFIKDNREKYDYASARGVAKLNVLLELIIPFLKNKGLFIALKGKKAFEEEKDALNAMSVLSVLRVKVEEFNLPTNQEKRINLYYQKQKSTSLKYPRSFANIKKKPL